MTEYTITQLCKMYSKSKCNMYKVLRMTDIKPVGLRNKVYDASILKYLDKRFRIKTEVEIIQVPVYIDVNWLILPSKLNYTNYEEL